MDPLIIFVCIFAPTFTMSLLSAGRDQILFETREKSRRSVVLLMMAAALIALLALGLPPAWALALVLPGPLGSGIGDWVGSGQWIVLRHRIERLLGRGRD